VGYPRGYAGKPTDERPLDDESASEVWASEELTAEEASRLAVTALAADLEFWARAVSVDGWVGVNDLIHTLDMAREASVPAV
jgi:antirestriction protein ArdC